MAQVVEITPKGIKYALRRYDFKQALAEYVWNGFDAKATEVHIKSEYDEIGNIKSIKVTDNGYGIPRKELKHKFKPFFDSQKVYEVHARNTSATHGKNGVGRLTFFKFALIASWTTTYELEGKKFRYGINVSETKLNSYSDPVDLPVTDGEYTGTEVLFEGIHDITQANIDGAVTQFLKREFCWFLELNKDKKFKILINGELLDYAELMGDHEETTILDEESKTEFSIRYVRWVDLLNLEYSRFYFIDSSSNELFKDFTLLNNKGDHFYHSIFVKSKYFDNFNYKAKKDEKDQESLFGGNKTDKVYKFIIKELNDYLRTKRKPFLKAYADKLIVEYNASKVMPDFKDNEYDQLRKRHLEEVIKAFYEAQPKIYTNLNFEQKKTFVGFLNLLLDTTDREQILEIIKHVVELSPEEKTELLGVLQSTRLSHITQTIKMLQDRVRTIDRLKELVFNESLSANERDHLQEVIESHYWIFGEQYHLVTAAEQKFEEALKRYRMQVRGEDKKIKMDHPDKNGEMDIFICRQRPLEDLIENVVIELKHPAIPLGEVELSQVKKYLGVILSKKEFNDLATTKWTFYLVGSKYDTSGFIQREIQNMKFHGEKSLVFVGDTYKIYVKTWSEMFNDFELRHNFINERLKIQREKLSEELKSADEIVREVVVNSAAVV